MSCHFLLAQGKVPSTGTRDGVYIKEKEKKPPVLRCMFGELKDSAKIKQVKGKVLAYGKYKKLPFAYPRLLFVNPALSFDQLHPLFEKGYQLQSLWYYLDTIAPLKKDNITLCSSRLPYASIYQPFAILDHEVSNAEYREFVYYVRDSIARGLLAGSDLPIAGDYGYHLKSDTPHTGGLILKWNKKIPYDTEDTAINQVLRPLYTDTGNRFYNRRQTDTRKLNFQYTLSYMHVREFEAEKGWQIVSPADSMIRSSNIVNIYPDTLAWVYDLSRCSSYWQEPMCNMYFWHPAYNDHPVVGLSIQQITAFLKWKTDQLQKQLNAQKLPYTVAFSLPAEPDIELLELIKKKDKVQWAEHSKMSLNFLYDLFPPELRLILNENSRILNSKQNRFIADNWYFETLAKNYQAKYPMPYSPKEITLSFKPVNRSDPNTRAHYQTIASTGTLPFLNGNVSEWMQERFTSNDTAMYIDIHEGQRELKSIGVLLPDPVLQPVKGNFLNAFLLYLKINGDELKVADDSLKTTLFGRAPAGNRVYHLVRRGNWFDSGDWMTAAHKRNFASCDSAYSTLGFRYVIRFREKEAAASH